MAEKGGKKVVNAPPKNRDKGYSCGYGFNPATHTSANIALSPFQKRQLAKINAEFGMRGQTRKPKKGKNQSTTSTKQPKAA